MKTRAEYRNEERITRTRFYDTPEQAQDALAKRIGSFRYLGEVAGDCFEFGRCTWAPRNGGSVNLLTVEDI